MPLLYGVTIGEYALIGSGLLLQRCASFALVIGNPGRVVGTVDKQGNRSN